MSHGTSTLTRFGAIREYPADLAAVSVGALLAYGIVTSFPDGSELRLLVTVPLALFLPGYALISVLFPATERGTQEATSTPVETRPRGIDLPERLGLSFALSLTIVPIVAIALPFTEWGFNTVSTAAALALITVALAQIGVVRRLRTPKSDRFMFSPVALIARLRRDDTAVMTASSLVLVLAIGLATGALLIGFLAPMSAGGFSELALYGENEDGDLVAGEIESEIEPGESVPVTVSVENQEGEETEYTVVIQEQLLEDGDVVERTQLGELETTLADETTETSERSVAPTAEEGETVRISVLLFHGEPPAEPTNENAAEDTYFWVTIEE
ncbi:DUF1616 domain-containing protein [Natronorubrum thiooxidans]|uniref:Uncharacterized membrane protein n=1 Tax=Natronorubrum thiooxidans TaxID=308853 RepID=A0A1N7FN95_9EURY|nr:DUF1616 domain-containing protein [Natronorubrum thiooxidans]SIS01888.1 Uncharacterized membrane protein [Natronorubrum thiooxidans]